MFLVLAVRYPLLPVVVVIVVRYPLQSVYFSCTSVSVCRPVIDVYVFMFAFWYPLQTVVFRSNVPGVRCFLSTHPFPFPKISPCFGY